MEEKQSDCHTRIRNTVTHLHSFTIWRRFGQMCDPSRNFTIPLSLYEWCVCASVSTHPLAGPNSEGGRTLDISSFVECTMKLCSDVKMWGFLSRFWTPNWDLFSLLLWPLRCSWRISATLKQKHSSRLTSHQIVTLTWMSLSSSTFVSSSRKYDWSTRWLIAL